MTMYDLFPCSSRMQTTLFSNCLSLSEEEFADDCLELKNRVRFNDYTAPTHLPNDDDDETHATEEVSPTDEVSPTNEAGIMGDSFEANEGEHDIEFDNDSPPLPPHTDGIQFPFDSNGTVTDEDDDDDDFSSI